MSRLRVLLFCRTYLPGEAAGGPIRTLANLVEVLGDEFDFRIVTLDRDYNASAPYPGVNPGTFVSLGKAQVCYLRPQDVTDAGIEALIEREMPDILYLNSVFDSYFPRRVLKARKHSVAIRIPTVMAVRGQFNPGALALRSMPKRLYLGWLKTMGLLDGLLWQATGEPEVKAIVATLGKNFLHRRSKGIRLAPDISRALGDGAKNWQPRGEGEPLRIALLGRVSPMKNIAAAIDAVGAMRHPAVLTIYGPIEDRAYASLCEVRIAQLPSHRNALFAGTLPPDRVVECLSAYDCFLLPTRGENYGHAIAEALAAGLPVVISDRTPWNDVEERGVGKIVPLEDLHGFTQALDWLAALPSSGMRALHDACADYAEATLTDEAVVEASRALFRSGLAASDMATSRQ